MPLQLPSYGTSGNASALAAPKGNYDIEIPVLEISLNTHPITGKFEWSSDFQISFSKNKLKGLAGYSQCADCGFRTVDRCSQCIQCGRIAFNFYGFVCDGVLQGPGGPSDFSETCQVPGKRCIRPLPIPYGWVM